MQEKKYGIKIRMGTIVPLSIEQYQKIIPQVATGSGMITVDDRTINVKDIVEIAPLVELDREVLRGQKMWRCSHGTVYNSWESCTCNVYGGTGFIPRFQDRGILPKDYRLELKETEIKKLKQ